MSLEVNIGYEPIYTDFEFRINDSAKYPSGTLLNKMVLLQLRFLGRIFCSNV
jgi:hypothetical protein